MAIRNQLIFRVYCGCDALPLFFGIKEVEKLTQAKFYETLATELIENNGNSAPRPSNSWCSALITACVLVKII